MTLPAPAQRLPIADISARLRVELRAVSAEYEQLERDLETVAACDGGRGDALIDSVALLSAVEHWRAKRALAEALRGILGATR